MKSQNEHLEINSIMITPNFNAIFVQLEHIKRQNARDAIKNLRNGKYAFVTIDTFALVAAEIKSLTGSDIVLYARNR